MNKLKLFFMLTFSTLLIAFGTYFFKFTNNFTFGGITGLAVLIAKTGLISAGDFNFIASNKSTKVIAVIASTTTIARGTIIGS